MFYLRVCSAFLLVLCSCPLLRAAELRLSVECVVVETKEALEKPIPLGEVRDANGVIDELVAKGKLQARIAAEGALGAGGKIDLRVRNDDRSLAVAGTVKSIDKALYLVDVRTDFSQTIAGGLTRKRQQVTALEMKAGSDAIVAAFTREAGGSHVHEVFVLRLRSVEDK